MPVIVTCPQCDKKLRVPDNLLGKKVRCPGCSGMFIGRAEEAPPPEEEQAPAPPKPAKASARPEPPPEDEDDEAPPARAGKAGVVRGDDLEDKPKPRRSVVPPPVKDGYEDEESHKRRRSRREDDYDEDDYADARRRRDEDDDDYEEDDRSRGARDEDYDDDYDDYDDGQGGLPRAVREGWRKVRLGITLYLTAIFVAIGWLVVYMCGSFAVVGAAVSNASSSGTPAGAVGAATSMTAGLMVLLVANWVVNLGTQILAAVSHYFGLAVPPKRGSAIKGLAIATLALSLTSLLGGLGAQIIQVATAGLMGLAGALPGMSAGGIAGFGIAVVIGLIAAVAGIACFFVYLFYLRAVAQNTQNQRLARQLKTHTISWGVLAGVGVLTLVIGALVLGAAIFSVGTTAGRGAGGGPAAAAGFAFIGLGIVWCLGAIAALALFIWFIVILFQVRSSIDSYLRRN